MSFLFDTNAISEVFRRRPNLEYVGWLGSLPRAEQYTSTIVAAELLAGANASRAPKKWLERYERDVLPRLTLLPFDYACARAFGALKAALRSEGTPIGDSDTLIAATALAHGLTLVTANERHFARVPNLTLHVFKPGEQQPQ